MLTWSHNDAHAAFTLRDGGVSLAPFDTLNLGLHVGDDPHDVAINRARVMETLGLAEVRCAEQVHGVDVSVEPGDTWDGHIPSGRADALVTSVPARGIAVMIADCAPVVIAGNGSVAVIHAGWRGLAEGILEAALTRMLGEHDTSDLRAAIGPTIGPCCFEVGEDVAGQFPSAHVRREEGKQPHVDMPGVIAARLRRRKIAVDDFGVCTSCDPRCFSHRRDRGATGRQALVAWIGE